MSPVVKQATAHAPRRPGSIREKRSGYARRCRGDPLSSPSQSSSMKYAAAGKEGKTVLRSIGIAAGLLTALAASVLYLATLARAG